MLSRRLTPTYDPRRNILTCLGRGPGLDSLTVCGQSPRRNPSREGNLMTGNAEASTDRARLIEIIKQRSVEPGRVFKLASGRTSDFYCNLKPTMMHPEGAHLLGRLIAEALDGTELDMIGGLEMGAVPLATAAAAASFACSSF